MANRKNPAAIALGKLGGRARAEVLTPAERSEIASKGGEARAKKLSAAERKRISILAVRAKLAKRSGRGA
jgi:hypothetical protein